MFDSAHVSTNTTSINAVSGTLVKTHSKSKFIKFHMNSKVANWIFHDYPHVKTERGCAGPEVVVLQVMICPCDYMLAEYVELAELEKGEG